MPTRDKQGGTTLYVSQLEMWAVRGVGLILLGLTSWIGAEIRESAKQMQLATLAIAEIRTELTITKPADVLQAVNQLERVVPSKAEIEALMATQAPWAKVEDEWRTWRASVESSLEVMSTAMETGTRDRLYRREIVSWIESLKRSNPDLVTPDFK